MLCIHVCISRVFETPKVHKRFRNPFTLQCLFPIFRVSSCGSSVTNNCTYIQNPSYPSSESSGSCSYNVRPLSADICQLRLDFDNFDLTETSTNVGTCVDSFDVTSGSSRDYFKLCGTLSGQHIYVETGRKTTDQTLSFTIGTTSTVATWRIKVNQLACYRYLFTILKFTVLKNP